MKIVLKVISIMQRVIIHLLIIIACYHICYCTINNYDYNWIHIIIAFCVSGNVFWFSDYAYWLFNIKKELRKEE